MELGPAALALITFALLAGAWAALYYAWFRGAEANLGRLLEPEEAAAGAGGGQGRGGGALARALEALTRAGLRDRRASRNRQLTAALGHAGYGGVYEYLVFRVIQGGAVAGGVVAGVWLGWATGIPEVFTVSFGLVMGLLMPLRVLRQMGAARQGRIARELPAILDLLAVSLEAGLGLNEALKTVSRGAERHSPSLSNELRAAVAQMSTGATLSEVWYQTAERTGSEELRAIVHLLVQSEQLGARLAPALRAGAEQLATRRRIRAEEHAHQASIKMLLPLVLLILPAMLIVMLGPAFLQLITVLGQ